MCRDRASREPGPQWLERSGFRTTLLCEPERAPATARELQPSVIVVEAALRDADGRRLYEKLRDCGADAPLPMILLCASASEIQATLDSGATTALVRKPFDWQLIGQRAAQVADLSDSVAELARLRRELEFARTDADIARRELQLNEDTDELTGLASRLKFRRMLERSLGVRGKSGTAEMTILVIRLNRFRLVNEALGHEKGNRLLMQIGERLRRCLDHSTVGRDIVSAAAARLGGIRFGILVSGLSGPTEVRELAGAILEVLCQPFRIKGQSLYLSASVGGAMAPADGKDADGLLEHAETALREAKQRGGGFSLFHEPLVAGSARQLQLDGMLHEALDRGQLDIEYQPMLDLDANRIVGAEALLRWHHPLEGPISPVEFIPIAENNGLMTRLGAIVIDGACSQLRKWLDEGAADLRICINLSLYQLRHDDVVDIVARALHMSDLPPQQVELELSERGVVGRDSEVLRQLHELKSLGVRLAIDDFGTGESAIAYLKELPIDVLKIDRSYIMGALDDGRDATIVAAMIALARSLGLTVVAEGVEVGAQIEMLRDWGCHQYQGFYFSPAVPGHRFLPLIARAGLQTEVADPA